MSSIGSGCRFAGAAVLTGAASGVSAAFGAGAATLAWPNAPLTIELKAVIINFYAGNEPSVDADNMSKPILDALQNIAYANDRQVVQARLTHARLDGAYQIGGRRPIIVTTLQVQAQFVYVSIEEPESPFLLPG